MKNDSTFTPLHPLKTSVLFLVFNRFDTTKQVFEAIKHAKPPRLYIAADGAREGKQGEDEKVKEVRDYVMSHIDWDCEIKTLFREKNLGCKYAVSGAIDWFFENEEMGIILEDDCLPSQSFFWFCEELLERYKDDMRVWHISGDNFQNGIKRGDGDYYFSKYNHIWGWASWRDRWQYYDVEMKSFEHFTKQKQIQNNIFDKIFQQYWFEIFNNVYENKIDTWDYQWTYTMWCNSGLSVLPNINIVSNIGFGNNSVHTKYKSNPLANIPKKEISVPLLNPKFVICDTNADLYSSRKEYSSKNIIIRAFDRIIKIVK